MYTLPNKDFLSSFPPYFIVLSYKVEIMIAYNHNPPPPVFHSKKFEIMIAYNPQSQLCEKANLSLTNGFPLLTNEFVCFNLYKYILRTK